MKAQFLELLRNGFASVSPDKRSDYLLFLGQYLSGRSIDALFSESWKNSFGNIALSDSDFINVCQAVLSGVTRVEHEEYVPFFHAVTLSKSPMILFPAVIRSVEVIDTVDPVFLDSLLSDFRDVLDFLDDFHGKSQLIQEAKAKISGLQDVSLDKIEEYLRFLSP